MAAPDVPAPAEQPGTILGLHYFRANGSMWWHSGARTPWDKLPKVVRGNALIAISDGLRQIAADVAKVAELACGREIEISLVVPGLGELQGKLTLPLPVQVVAREAL